jgi:uncharacterized membrane protein
MEIKRTFEKEGQTINVVSLQENDVMKVETEIRQNKFGREFVYASVNGQPNYLVNLSPNQAKQLKADHEKASIVGKSYKAYSYVSAKFGNKKFIAFSAV